METIIKSPITREIIDQAMSYEQFNSLTQSLFEEGRTTNDNNSQSMLDYTKLNLSRTNRIDKRGLISEETAEVIQDIEHPQTWFVITEGWCGDSAQLLPYIHKMADLNNNVDLKIILRDEYPEVMDAFLTNGVSRSIPKMVVLDQELTPIGEWGPRPVEVQNQFLADKDDPEIGMDQAKKNLHTFYAKDKGAQIQEEFRTLFRRLK